MTLVCPAHISSCGQLFRPVGAHQHSVANGGAAHPDIYSNKYVSKVLFESFLWRKDEVHVVSVTFLKCSRCHTNVVFSVVRAVRCDCGFVNNVVGHIIHCTCFGFRIL